MSNPWTYEQEDWLRKNVRSDISFKELSEMYNEHFEVPRTSGCIRLRVEKLGLYELAGKEKKTIETFPWSDDEKQFFIENAGKMAVKELVEKHNELFPIKRSNTACRSYAKSHGIKLSTYSIKKFSTEMDEWLAENVDGRWIGEYGPEFRKLFGEEYDNGSIRNHVYATLKLRNGLHNEWDKESEEFIASCKSTGLTAREIAKQYNEKFGRNVTVPSIKCLTKRLGINKEKQDEKWTDEQSQWIVDHCAEFKNYEELTDRFNEVFGTNRHPRGIQSHAVRYLNLLSGRQGLKAGADIWNDKELGSETTLGSGYTVVKTGKGEWAKKQKVIYEEAYGKLPDNMFVVFLDRNNQNFSLDNLYAVDRKIHAQMNVNGWYSEDPNITKAALKLCELNSAIKDIRKEE